MLTDVYDNLDYDNDDIVKEVETTIDKVSIKHNVKTDVMYNYIDKETGHRIWRGHLKVFKRIYAI